MKFKNKLDVGVESVIFFQIDSAFLKSKKKKDLKFFHKVHNKLSINSSVSGFGRDGSH